jgi:hypothetical protein
MQTNKKTNPAGEAFNLANSMTNITRSGHAYGKLFAIKDMQIYLLQEEKKIKDEIEKLEKGKTNE